MDSRGAGRRLASDADARPVERAPAQHDALHVRRAKNVAEKGEMEKKKYWRNVIRGPFYIEGEPGTKGTSLSAHNNEYGNGTTLGYHCINTYYEAPTTHSHDFHELLVFVGG